MALEKKMCIHHFDRPAIGECVITSRPICAECTTRYQGVNYSKEGLEILRRRREAAGAAGMGERAAGGLLLAAAPVFLLFLYWFYLAQCRLLINLLQMEL